MIVVKTERGRILRLEAITKRFPGVTALDRVSFVICPGEIHALCGENGAGKSTLMNVLAGIWPYGTYEGRIVEVDPVSGAERELRFHDVNDAAAAGIAIVHQELALMPLMSVLDNLFLGREIRRVGGRLAHREQATAAREHLRRLGLRLPLDAEVRELGVGQQQRLEIARALLGSPSVLVLDEPTSALPDDEAASLLAWIRRLAEGGTACVYISHRMEEVFRIADRITVLRDGRTIWTKAANEIEPDAVIEAMVDRPPSAMYAHAPLPAGDIVCEVRGLRIVRAARTILNVEDLRVRRGEIVGLAGMMGAGRTCLLRSLVGGLRNVRAHGAFRGPLDPSGIPGRLPRNPHEAMRRGLFLIPEDRKQQALFLDADVAVNVTNATAANYRSGAGFDMRAMLRSCEEKMKRFGVKARGPLAPVSTLSGGNQQRVLLCRAADVAPRLLLLDEPTRGIDVGAKEEIYRQMEAWTREGWSILWSSSELQELLGISDRIYVLADGRVTGVFAERPFSEKEIMARAAAA